jgi:translation initiation factor 2-alpha kinase 4
MVRKYESGLSTRLMIKENEEERSFGYWSPAVSEDGICAGRGSAGETNTDSRKRCDVYVAAGAQVDLTTRLSIVGELWRAGIRADLQVCRLDT